MRALSRLAAWLDANERKVLIAIAAIALALGLIRIHSQPLSIVTGQTDNFWPIANHLLDGEGYTLCYPLYFPFCPGDKAPPTAMREPVPSFLFAAAAAISGRSLLFTMHVQVLMSVGIVLLTFLFTRAIAGGRAALLASLAWAVYLPPIFLQNQLSGDLVGTFFLLCSACILVRARREVGMRWWLFAGASLGVAALSRSALLLMLLPWCLAAWHHGGGIRAWRTAWRPAALVFASTLAVMSPWAIRNYQVFGKAWLGTSMNGYNVWRMSSHVGTDEPIHYVDPFEADSMSQKLLARRTDLKGTENEAEMDKVYMAEGMAQVKKNPAKYVRLCGYRFVQLLTNLHVREAYGIVLNTIDRVTFVQQLIYLALTAIGLWKLRRSQWVWLVAIAIQLAGYTALVGQMRYLIPIMPIFLAFAGYALSRLLWRENVA